MARQTLARAARALVLSVGATAAAGEGSERYDDSRHVAYATRQLRRRRQLSVADGNSATAPDGLWLQRETPKFPYVVALSPADNPVRVDWLLGARASVVGSPLEPTSDTLDALVAPLEDAPLDSLVHRVATQWLALKTKLRGDVPAAFDTAQQRALERRLAALLAALKAEAADEAREQDVAQGGQAADPTQPASDPETASAGEKVREPQEPQQQEQQEQSSKSEQRDHMVFYLRDFDEWEATSTATWSQWIHEVTSAALAHAVVPTRTPVTQSAIREWQRAFKVPDAEFVAILLRAATRACDASEAQEKLAVLSEQFALDLRGLGTNEETEGDDVIGFAAPAPPTESQLIVETVGNWWRDLETVCHALETRGLREMKNDDERLVLVQQVCEEYERDAMIHVMSTLGIQDPAADDDERISALQAWKCLEVVTQVSDDAQILASPQKLMQRDTSKPLNCAHPVEALLPFNQRVHGEAKFLELIDQGILYLRPKNDVEIGVVPCDTKALVAPCWVETRPLIKRAFEKLWRDDELYTKVLELERFEDNRKLNEEVVQYEEEINERRKVFDAQTREFIMIQHAMKKHEVAQRKAELALLELEIQSKLVYLERLRGLLD